MAFDMRPSMKRIGLLVALAGFSFLFAACQAPPFSQHPLSRPGEQPNDERLSGVWTFQEKEDQDSVFFHISREKESWLDIVIIGSESQGGLA